MNLGTLPPPLDLLPGLLEGLVVTVGVFSMAAVGGLLTSAAAGLATRSVHRVPRFIARTYIEVFRGTSALVQLFWFFFVLPFFGIHLSPFAAGSLVLALNLGAYGAEVVRGNLQALPEEQWEAAAALGMTRRQQLFRVALPQAIPGMLPPFGNLLIELLKNTALVSLITLNDLTFAAQTVRADTLRTAAIFGWVLLLYFLLAQLVKLMVSGLESRFAFASGKASS